MKARRNVQNEKRTYANRSCPPENKPDRKEAVVRSVDRALNQYKSAVIALGKE